MAATGRANPNDMADKLKAWGEATPHTAPASIIQS